jgi:di/tricarboxylate transporter
MLAAATLSLFMNNIAAAGVLLPAVVALSRQSRIPPSRLLMPLAFGTILGGMATLLTTANIIVSGVLRDAGLRPFGLLDFLPVGIGIVLAGTLYMVGIGRHRLPARYPAGQAARAVQLRAELAGIYGIQKSLCELQVRRGSALAGLNLRQGEWRQRLGLHVVGVARGSHVQMAPAPEEIIQEGDVVFAQGDPNPEQLEQYGLVLFAQPTLPLQITDESTLLGELILSPHARVVGRSLRDLQFREKFGLNVVAIFNKLDMPAVGLKTLADIL